jgi:predicted dehydrogenase
MDAKVNVGIIGCGNIFPAYMKGSRAFKILDVVACADIDQQRAQDRAAEFNVPKAYGVADLLNDPDVQIAVNLTVPLVHAEVSLTAIEAGKNVHSEKPLAVHREDGQRIIEAAKAQGVLVGCAPDTFLGGGLQTCRKLIDDGAIGTPVAATAFMAGHGPESWHPNPDFFYKLGGGPLFDVGPYYLTALVHLLGAVRRVSGSAHISFPERVATSKELYGRRIAVDVPTHITGVLDFESGVVGTIITSFDIWAHHLPRIEIYGSDGTLSVPDPNTFGGPVQLWRTETKQWEDVPLTHSADVGRGIGVADMAYALTYKRPIRASGALAYHVLDLMHALHESSQTGTHITPTSQAERPAALPLNLPVGELDQ